MLRVREKLRLRLDRATVSPWKEVAASLNRLLAGWANYFSYGSRTAAYQAVDLYVEDRVRDFLCRRHKRRGRGYRQFGMARIFGELGVTRLETRLRRKPTARAST